MIFSRKQGTSRDVTIIHPGSTCRRFTTCYLCAQVSNPAEKPLRITRQVRRRCVFDVGGKKGCAIPSYSLFILENHQNTTKTTSCARWHQILKANNFLLCFHPFFLFKTFNLWLLIITKNIYLAYLFLSNTIQCVCWLLGAFPKLSLSNSTLTGHTSLTSKHVLSRVPGVPKINGLQVFPPENRALNDSDWGNGLVYFKMIFGV